MLSLIFPIAKGPTTDKAKRGVKRYVMLTFDQGFGLTPKKKTSGKLEVTFFKVFILKK